MLSLNFQGPYYIGSRLLQTFPAFFEYSALFTPDAWYPSLSATAEEVNKFVILFYADNTETGYRC